VVAGSEVRRKASWKNMWKGWGFILPYIFPIFSHYFPIENGDFPLNNIQQLVPSLGFPLYLLDSGTVLSCSQTCLAIAGRAHGLRPVLKNATGAYHRVNHFNASNVDLKKS
jgi:hypothetical protein